MYYQQHENSFESNCLPQNAMLANFQNIPRVDKEKKKK